MRIQPLDPGFGARVTGFDLIDGRDPADIAALQAAYARWNLLVFHHDGVLPPERQVEITGWFGPIGANRDEQGRPWTTLHNDHATGSAVLPFHCDISFMPYPLEGISLHPLALPATPTSTTFVSNALGWDALSEPLRRRLENLRGRHFYASSGEMGMDWPVFEAWHPVRKTHPRTGQTLLFVTERHVDRFDTLDGDAGRALLDTLFATLYDEARRYEHRWSVGDLVIWDNLAIQHARTRPSPPSSGVRQLQRVALGEHGFIDQLETRRRQAALSN